MRNGRKLWGRVLLLLRVIRRREGALGGKGRGHHRSKVFVGRHDGWGSTLEVFLVHLHGAHAPDCLFPFDPLFLASLQDLFVLDAQFATLYVKSIECSDDGICIAGCTEVGKSKATELTRLI